METELESMVVRLTGDGSSFQQMWQDAEEASQKAGQEIEGLTEKVEDFAKNAAQALAALGLGSLLANALGNFQEAEDIGQRLSSVMRANGRDIESTMGLYEDFASQIQATTTLEDDFILSLLRTAETFNLTGQSATQATQDAIALSFAIDGTADSANSLIRLTGALANGNVKQAMQFARMVPQLRGITNESEFVARAQQLIAAGMQSANDATQTSSAGFAMLSRDFGNMLEDFGKVVAEGARPFVDALREMVAWFNDLDDSTKSTIVVVAALATGLLALGPIVAGLGLLINLAFSPFTLIIGGIIAGLALLTQALGGVGPTIEIIRSGFQSFWDWFQPVWDAFVGVVSAAWEAIEAGASALWDTITGIWDSLVGEAEIDWAAIRDAIVTALEFCEFTIRNFGMVAENVWIRIKLGFMVAVDFIKDAGIALVANVSAAVMAIGEVFSTLWDAVSGGGFEAFEGLGDRMSATFTRVHDELSTAMGAGESDITRGLRRELEANNEVLGQAFEDFQRERRAANQTEQDEVEEDWSEFGEQSSDQYNEGFKKGMEKFDAVLAGSAEAFSRIAEFQDKILAMRGGAASTGGTGAAGVRASGAPVVVNSPPPARADAAGSTQITLLTDIRDILRDRSSAIEIEAAGLS